MKKYIESISRLNTVALSATDDEIDRCAEADIFWSQHKEGNTNIRSVRKGGIYQFEFGKNYKPEMAYEHRGLIIGISKKLLYVLPIYTYKPDPKEEPPLHIQDNPHGNSIFYLLKKQEYTFLRHDSVIKLNDMRTVSRSRIKYAHNAAISPSSSTYAFIENRAFRHYFPSISYAYDQLKEEHAKAMQEIDRLQKIVEKSTDA